MTNHTILEPLLKDQWFIESQELRSFVTTVREISACTANDRTQTLARLKPYFQELLAQQEWLPEKFAQVNPESSMGKWYWSMATLSRQRPFTVNFQLSDSPRFNDSHPRPFGLGIDLVYTKAINKKQSIAV